MIIQYCVINFIIISKILQIYWQIYDNDIAILVNYLSLFLSFNHSLFMNPLKINLIIIIQIRKYNLNYRYNFIFQIIIFNLFSHFFFRYTLNTIKIFFKKLNY